MNIELLLVYCYRAFIFACVTGLAYTLVYLMVHLINKKTIQTKKFFLKLIFFCYVACLFQITVIRDWQLFFDYAGWQHSYDTVQLDMFYTLSNAYQYKWTTFIYHCFGNILWFVPMGFLLPLICKWFNNVIKVVLFGACFSLMIEGLQWLFNSGISDIDDFITNTLGTLLGYLIYRIVKKWKK
ncbi:MAG: VanZ family protein [Erysipelotrichaceae bacterium]